MYSTILPFNYKNICQNISLDRKSLCGSEKIIKITSQEKSKNDIETQMKVICKGIYI